jgi:hypothetical protein
VGPPCQRDADCPTGLTCQVTAAVCVGFTTPLVSPTDGGDAGDGTDG